MIEAVASQRAIAAGWSRTDVLDGPAGGGRLHIEGIEINEMLGCDDAMGIVAGRASRLLIHDVEAVPAVLAQAIGRAETLVIQDAFAAVTFIAKRIIAGVLGILIGDQKLSLKDGGKG